MNDDELKELREIRVGLNALQVDLKDDLKNARNLHDSVRDAGPARAQIEATVEDALTTLKVLVGRIDQLRISYQPDPASVQALTKTLEHYDLYETDDEWTLCDLNEHDSVRILQMLHEQFGLVISQGETDDGRTTTEGGIEQAEFFGAIYPKTSDHDFIRWDLQRRASQDGLRLVGDLEIAEPSFPNADEFVMAQMKAVRE